MRMKTAVELVRNQDRARLQRMQQRVDQSEPTLCSLRFSSERNGNARGAVSLMIELDRKSRPLKGVVDRALYPSRFCHPLKEVLRIDSGSSPKPRRIGRASTIPRSASLSSSRTLGPALASLIRLAVELTRSGRSSGSTIWMCRENQWNIGLSWLWLLAAATDRNRLLGLVSSRMTAVYPVRVYPNWNSGSLPRSRVNNRWRRFRGYEKSHSETIPSRSSRNP